MSYPETALRAAVTTDKQQLLKSDMCGCYHCTSTFHPFNITEWTLDEKAICPKCGIDSVVGNSPTADFLKALNSFWFSTEKI